nr:helix-turn-helix transcriptional regulator [uncultured Blautia sp.]
MSEKECKVDELLTLFADSITSADILAAKIMAQISTAITKERLKLRMNQARFAQHINVSQSLVEQWECGDYNFSVKELADICAILNLDMQVSFLQLHDSVQGNEHLLDDDMKEKQ